MCATFVRRSSESLHAGARGGGVLTHHLHRGFNRKATFRILPYSQVLMSRCRRRSLTHQFVIVRTKVGAVVVVLGFPSHLTSKMTADAKTEVLRDSGDRTPHSSSVGKFPNATNTPPSPLHRSCQLELPQSNIQRINYHRGLCSLVAQRMCIFVCKQWCPVTNVTLLYQKTVLGKLTVRCRRILRAFDN